MKPSLRSFLVHLLAWTLLGALVLAFVDPAPNGNVAATISSGRFLFFLFFFAGLFYLNDAVLVPRLYLTRRFAVFAAATLLLLATTLWLKPFENLLHHQRGRPRPPVERVVAPPPFRGQQRPPPAVRFDITSLVLFFLVTSLAVMQNTVRKWRQTEQQALQAQRDKVAAELSFLKAQINPHFLFNTLNNIYALATAGSEKTADAVLKLSNILRYVTDEIQSDFVPLAKEVACAADFIDLQKLRLSPTATVLFSVEGNTAGKSIAPLLLMTFLENAFKYGISNHEPCRIEVHMLVRPEALEFRCRNQVFVRPYADERRGLGIANARKRLAHLYPNRHHLQTVETADQFSVHLTLYNT